MKANEIMPSWAIENGTLVPAAITPVAAAEPAPMYTRQAVPITSAKSFCGVVGAAVMRFARRLSPEWQAAGAFPPSSSGAKFLEYRSGSWDSSLKEDKSAVGVRQS